MCYETLGTLGILPMSSISCGHVGHMVCCACVLQMTEHKTERGDFYHICPECRTHTTGYVAAAALVDMDNDVRATELLAQFKAKQDARKEELAEEPIVKKQPVRRRLVYNEVAAPAVHEPAARQPALAALAVKQNVQHVMSQGTRVAIDVDLRGFGVPPCQKPDSEEITRRLSPLAMLVLANAKLRFSQLPQIGPAIKAQFPFHEADYGVEILPSLNVDADPLIPGKYFASAEIDEISELVTQYKNTDGCMHPDLAVIDQHGWQLS